MQRKVSFASVPPTLIECTLYNIIEIFWLGLFAVLTFDTNSFNGESIGLDIWNYLGDDEKDIALEPLLYVNLR